MRSLRQQSGESLGEVLRAFQVRDAEREPCGVIEHGQAVVARRAGDASDLLSGVVMLGVSSSSRFEGLFAASTSSLLSSEECLPGFDRETVASLQRSATMGFLVGLWVRKSPCLVGGIVRFGVFPVGIALAPAAALYVLWSLQILLRVGGVSTWVRLIEGLFVRGRAQLAPREESAFLRTVLRKLLDRLRLLTLGASFAHPRILSHGGVSCA